MKDTFNSRNELVEEMAKGMGVTTLEAARYIGFIEENLSTLRDQFAMAALPALMSELYVVASSFEEKVQHIARLSYQLADAMLTERSKEPTEKTGGI